MKPIGILSALVISLLLSTSSRAQDDICETIVKNIRDTFEHRKASQFEQEISHYVDKTHQEAEAQANAREKAAGGGIAIPIKNIIVGLKGQWGAMTSDQRSKEIRARLIDDFESRVRKSDDYSAYISVANPGLVESLNTCIKGKFGKRGLVLDEVHLGEVLKITVKWDPAGNEAYKPAKVESSPVLVYAKLADGQRDPKDDEISRTGKTYTFVRTDPAQQAVVTIQTDQGSINGFLPLPPKADVPEGEAERKLAHRWQKFLEQFIAMPYDPHFPRVLATDGVYSDRICLRWDTFIPPNGGTLVRYEIWARAEGDVPQDKNPTGAIPDAVLDDANAREWVHTNLKPGQKYYYWIRPRWTEPNDIHANVPNYFELDKGQRLAARLGGQGAPYPGRTRDSEP